MVLYNRGQTTDPIDNFIFLWRLVMNKNINLIVLEKASSIVRKNMFGCVADKFGCVPCDKGALCDRCNTDSFNMAVMDKYNELTKK